MLTVHSFTRFCTAVALAATCAGSACHLYADDDPPVSDPQPAPQSDEKAPVQGKIIIVEPDGTRREYNFGSPPRVFQVRVPRSEVVVKEVKPVTVTSAVTGPRTADIPHIKPVTVMVRDYMIGLDCVEADAALRAQLGLGDKGLVVRSPLEKSPAAAAGFQAHDVLTKAGDKELAKVQDLLDAVQAAEGKPLTITLLRGGKEQTLDVAPVKRMDVTLPPPGADPKQIELYIRNLDHADAYHDARLHTLRMRAVRPGVVFEDHIELAGSEKLKEIESQLEKLKEQVGSLQKSIEELREKQNLER